MAKTSSGTLSVYPIRVDPHHGGAPNPVMLASRHPHQHPEWRLDPDADGVDWGAFGGEVLDASHSVLANLRAISLAPTFKCLTVLSVRASGLIAIDLLQSCSALVHLDLSSNKITHLGDGDFWASFRDLLVILLHGNMVSEWPAVGSLGKAPQLTYLTLFSNPVSKRKIYRTFTTNCCESLRGLDLHAVSDEEVVEGSPFMKGSRWRTCSSALALPQPLFKGLTEVALGSARDERAETGRSALPLTETKVRGDRHPRTSPYEDARVVSSVSRRVELLRKFHARNSPVIIVQRQVRRYICHQAVVAAAVRIQACVRKWMVKLQATNALQAILRMRGELHLVQEILTPAQLRSLSFFQRRIAGHFRIKMLVTCTQTLERFMGHVARRFSSFVARLDRAQVGGVVVASDSAGELAAAVTKALMVTTVGLSWDEAAEQTVGTITTVANCRLLRPFSYNDVPARLALEKDVETDGVFVTLSPAGSRLRAEPRRVYSRSFAATRASSPTRPFSGLREPKRDPRVRRRAGVFGSPRVLECIISRRNAPVYRLCLDRAEEGGRGGTGGGDLEKQLWIFRPTETRVLARVLWTLRNRSVAKHPVPYILERHLFRCAAATRLQAAWRGHVLRWNLVDTLASCLIVARAGVCIQRWWRYQTGLAARLRLCRRLWSLASAVSSPTMFMELDVFFTLTRGWRWPKDKDDIVFSFENGDRVATVKKNNNGTFGAFAKAAVECGQGKANAGQHCGPEGCAETFACRELPMWTRGSLVRELLSSDVQHRRVLRHVGALLTEGVKVKRVVWPVAAAAVAGASEPAKESSTPSSASYGLTQLSGDDKTLVPSAVTDIWGASGQSEVSGETWPGSTQQGTSCEDSGPPVDLGESHRDINMLELTFSSVQEARARALLLVLATEEPGVPANRPVAQLMTLGMLRRAAAGEPGQAIPLKQSAKIYERGDAVEVSVLKLSQGYGGTWLPGKLCRQIENGATYTVTLDNGRVEQNIPDDRLRPLDRKGIELALVGMSHLPSRWQRTARSLLTPADRLELELLRRSLLTTTPVEYSEEGPPQLLREAPPHEAGAMPAGELPHNFDGLSGRGIPLQSRLHSPGSPVGRDDARLGSPPLRWAGSQTMSSAKNRGGPVVGDLDKLARAAAAEDEATAASTWIPGNRFRRDLEKLVYMAARDNQDASKEKELSARRENVCRARNVERGGPSPRDRLEKLKAADVAMFRRASDALKDRSASEKARDEANRAENVATVKESMRDGKQLARLWVEDRQEKQTAEVRRREDEVEVERNRQLEKRQEDVSVAKTRATQRQAERSKKALYVAESNAFTANTSQLARYVGKYATMSNKSQNARGMRQWVKGKKIHEEDTRRRMLRRVQELQEQKRSEALRLRRVLAARGKARVAMDEAVVRHRLGTLTSPGSGLADDVLQVLRPSSRPQINVPSNNSGNDIAGEYGGTLSPWHDEYDENDGVLPREAFLVGESDDSVAHLEPMFETTAERGKGGSVRPIDTHHGGVDGDIAAAPLGVALPSKPENPRSSGHQQQRNRRLRANGDGKTVLIHANVPTVAAERRPRSSPGTSGALYGRPKSGHANPSLSLQRGLDYKGRGVQMASAAPSGKEQLPWPLGRRCL